MFVNYYINYLISIKKKVRYSNGDGLSLGTCVPFVLFRSGFNFAKGTCQMHVTQSTLLEIN